MSDPLKRQLLKAAIPHVPFDGWSPETFAEAIKDSGVDPDTAKQMCPRGAVDLTVAFHELGDAQMVADLADADLADLRFRDKVAHAIWLRLSAIDDKELVRRGTTLFALPIYAGDGARLIWGTADAIWTALGDTSEDVNWYTKRATLSGVYGSVVLYWLGDDSLDHQATRAFINRRIENVMQFEKFKVNPLVAQLASPLSRLTRNIKAPTASPRNDVPGRWTAPE
ncbi:MAG: COQ9 family protein [Paracoccaceae bacterium]|jgi:ubiquinone biosynthesis protein COQ9|nr:COQ9 family protein [Paracoccaceae bacterium]